MKLSIIIPTFCRPKLLRHGLRGIECQHLQISYEIIVVNDGPENDGTKEVIKDFSKKLNIRCIQSRSKEEKDSIAFRIAGFALNEGVKHAIGKHLLLMSPEMYIVEGYITEMLDALEHNPNQMLIPFGKGDDGRILKRVESGEHITKEDFDKIKGTLNTELPFFMCVNRQKYMSIGGYDENFIGYCFDDDDFVSRMLDAGCTYKQINMQVIHLYHDKDRLGLSRKQELYAYNQRLFRDKRARKEIRGKIDILRPWNFTKIPRIAHFYWGDTVLHYARFLTIYTFALQNPDWKIKYYFPKYKQPKQMWSTFELKYDISKLQDYTYELQKLPVEMIEVDFSKYLMPNEISEVFKSDLLRLYLLSRFGGLWSDMDILYFRPMTYIRENIKDNAFVDTIISLNEDYGHSIGFLLSAPENEYYDFVLEKTRKYYNPAEYQSLGIKILNTEVPTLKMIQDKFSKHKIITIDDNAVYSYNARHIKIIYEAHSLDHFTCNSIGMHWYAGHPLAGEFITKLNEDNRHELTNTIGEVLDLALDRTLVYVDYVLKNKGKT